MSDKNFNILFLCKRNGARSIMAEALLTRLGKGDYTAFSAGIDASGEIHEYTTDLLKTMNFSTEFARSKSVDEYKNGSDVEMDFIFSVSDDVKEEHCEGIKGDPLFVNWEVPDPVPVTGTEAEMRLAFSEAYRMLNNRISVFVNLPLNDHSKEELKKKLDAIKG